MNVAIAWSDWKLAESGGLPFLIKQFELREDLLGHERLGGWLGFQLDAGASVDQYAMLEPEMAAQYITSYEINYALADGTTDEDMEPYWPIVADRFRELSLTYSE